MSDKKPLGYLGGDIMTRGSNLARQEEYDKFKEANIPGEVYSPVMNKSINDKSNMTEEENNHLAEKIVEADVERLWNSDYTVLCPEQSAIGTMCEMGILYGWQYMCKKLYEIIDSILNNDEYRIKLINSGKQEWEINDILNAKIGNALYKELKRIANQKNYAHYFDIRTNHLNEKDWRRSFSINQFLYGIILAATADNTLHNSFDEIIPILQNQFKNDDNFYFYTEVEPIEGGKDES